jgi:hypothetical protein
MGCQVPRVKNEILHSVRTLMPLICEELKNVTSEEVRFLTTGTLHLREPKRDRIEIVLFGDGVLPVIEKTLWHFQKEYRFWVLSHALKELLVTLVRIPAECIIVIDRYRLHPVAQQRKEIHDYETIVYAGRLDAQKNIDVFLSVLNLLQDSQCFANKEVVICGPFQAYDANDMIDGFCWKKKPLIMGDIGSRWTSAMGNAAYFSFSTYRYEDYSVAAAEAQQSSFPLFLANWFCFRDMHSSALSLISPFTIWRAKRGDQKAIKEIADQIIFDSNSKNKKPLTAHEVSQQACYIKGKELLKIISSISNKEYNTLRAYFEAGGFPQDNSFFDPINFLLAGG